MKFGMQVAIIETTILTNMKFEMRRYYTAIHFNTSQNFLPIKVILPLLKNCMENDEQLCFTILLHDTTDEQLLLLAIDYSFLAGVFYREQRNLLAQKHFHRNRFFNVL